MILLVLTCFLLLIGLFYIIGLFNRQIAKLVGLILFVLINLKFNRKNVRLARKKIAKLGKILLYKRHLLANKITLRRLKTQLNKNPLK
ncbi:MAG: hypothetical protein PWQ35_477 [Patescibacteria group bacterium]|nr:hypothetical protein [Patescibacteria group bacterium]